MAKPDEDASAALRREEGPLHAFFDAARAEDTAPSPAFLAAVLADADRLRPRPPAARPRHSPAVALASFLRPVGGWAAATALAACLAAGFFAGALGAGSEFAAQTLWPDVASLDAPAVDPADFFDLGATEG